MRTLQLLAAIATLATLTACNTPAPRASTQMIPPSSGSAASMPVSANSMPVGDTVNAPRAASTGIIGVSRP